MAREWGSIRRLQSGRFQARYIGPDGERYTAPMTFTLAPDEPRAKEPKAARAWLRRVRADIEAGTWKSPAELAREAAEEAKKAQAEKFGSYAATWVEQRRNSKGQPLRPKTRHEYERQLANGLSVFAGDRLSAITPARVRKWHADRARVAATAAGAEARLLRAILNTALVDGIIETNPCPANLGRSSTGLKHRPPTIDELAALVAAMPPRLQLSILLAAYGGLRLSEWRALRRSDLHEVDGRFMVNVERAAYHVPSQGWVVGPPKSTEGVRVVGLPKSLTDDVRAHLDEYVGAFPGSLLFAPTRAEFLPDREFYKFWDAARTTAGVRLPVAWADDENKKPTAWESVVREHDLRGFYLTSMAMAGGTLRETMAAGGHSTVDASMRYQYAQQERLHDLADRLPPLTAKLPKVRRIEGS